MFVTLFKNKKSGKYFIRVRELDGDHALFATPPDENGNIRVINLSYDLFHEKPLELDDDYLLEQDLIAQEQLDKYRKHLAKDIIELYWNWYRSLTKLEIARIKKEGGNDAKIIRTVEGLIERGFIEEF